MCADKNTGWQISIEGTGDDYHVYAISPAGSRNELPCSYVEVHLRPGGFSEAIVYFANPELKIQCQRAADGVRAG